MNEYALIVALDRADAKVDVCVRDAAAACRHETVATRDRRCCGRGGAGCARPSPAGGSQWSSSNRPRT